jgi:hypothetical protein
MSEDRAESVVIKITDLDIKPGFKGSFLIGKDRAGAEFHFALRPDTLVRKISPAESTLSLSDLARQTSSPPFRIGETVVVAWKIDPSTSQQTAVKITALE